MRPCSSCPPSSAGADLSDMLAASPAISRLGDAHQPYSAERLAHGAAPLFARLGCGPAWIGVDMPVKWTGWEFAERVRDEDVAPPLYLPFGHRDAARRSTARINLSRRRAGGHQRGEQAPRPDYRANRVGAKATLVCRHRRLRPVRACRRYKEETSLVSEARTPGAAVSEQRPHDYAALHGNRRGEDHNLHTFDEFV